MRTSRGIFWVLLFTALASRTKADPVSSAAALLHRIISKGSDGFKVEVISPDAGRDVFEVESRNETIVLRGNNGVSIASALNYYLGHYDHRHISWSRASVELSSRLPRVPAKIRVVSPWQRRAYLNYCTFSYTAAWWDWARWQQEIDWMALHGVNMPLAVTGQEAVWQATLRRFRMNDGEIRQFLSGPAFLAWQWMANLEGWGGPLPQSWIDAHRKLGQQILERERELGMTPVLQGFTGFVPRVLKAKYPAARIQLKPKWCRVFEGTAQLDPLDPLFPQMGKAFLLEQRRLFGTDHLYAADPFHESAPPNKAPTYLPAVAKQILNTMKSADPNASIVMQTWSVRKPIVTNIPEDRLTLLALTGGGWQKTEGFWDRRWVAGVLQNYGGRVLLAGSLQRALSNAAELRGNTRAGQVAGIGMFPEGTAQNPVYFDAAAGVAWTDKQQDAAEWLREEISARYGLVNSAAQGAWRLILQSLYRDGAEEGSVESPICGRPALLMDRAAPNASFKRHYDPSFVWQAWEKLQAAAPQLRSVDEYRYDLVDLGRQSLADLSIVLQNDIASAYESSDKTALASASARFLELATDLDSLLGTRREFLLGNWLEDAKKWGKTAAERRQYERNARLQVTVWGPRNPEAILFDYSNRQWGGLIRDYYIPRWKVFLDFLRDQPASSNRFTGRNLKLAYGRPADEADPFYAKLSQWEQDWSTRSDRFPTAPSGDSVQLANRLLDKWNPVRVAAYRRFDLRTLKAKG